MAQQWDTKFELLQCFVKEFNRFPKTNENYQGVQLGRWTRTQRIQEGKGALSDERRNKLLSIGFSFGNRREDNWEKHIDLLKEYIKQHNQMPGPSTKFNGSALGAWCHEQRKREKEGILPSQRRETLSEMGFDFDYDYSSSEWEKMFVLLTEFVAENHRFPVYTEKYKGKTIGAWCSYQKNRVRAGNYDESRKRKLEELGFQFGIKNRDEVWSQMYALLKEFYDEYKRWPKIEESYKGFNLGIWCSNQKACAKKDSYLAERREKLLSIGLLSSVSCQENTWNERLAYVKQFHSENGRWPKTAELWNGHRIGAWLGTQLRKSKQATYPKHRRKKLEEAGILP